jgi:hypothetical protein
VRVSVSVALLHKQTMQSRRDFSGHLVFAGEEPGAMRELPKSHSSLSSRAGIRTQVSCLPSEYPYLLHQVFSH